MDWLLDILTTCIHHSELHFTVHWHTQTSVLSLLQSPIAISWQRISHRKYNSLTELYIPDIRYKVLFPQPHSLQLTLFFTASCTELPIRWQPSTHWVPGWRPFHTELLAFSSRAEFQLTTENWILSLTSQLLHFTQLNCTEPSWGPRYIASGRTQQETLSFCYCARVRFPGKMFTEPTGSITPLFYCSVHVCCWHYLATAAVHRIAA
jgi:hypothetical protein